MLISLHIENFALIDSLSLNFQEGFNVITGETGAGKSIIIEAINMILGERASANLIKTGTERAFVEATFVIKNNLRITKVLHNLGFIPEETLVISREITLTKSIARLNNRTISQSALKELSAFMFDLHGQHQHQSLLRIEEHLFILDSFGGPQALELRKKIAEEYSYLQNFLTQYNKLKGDKESREKEKEYLKFQIEEIKAAALEKGEYKNLLEEQQQLKNAVKIAEKTKEAFNAINKTSDDLHTAKQNVKELAVLDSTLEKLNTETNNVVYAAEDIIKQLRNYLATVAANPARLAEVSDRIDFIQSLKRKHFKIGTEPQGDIVALILEKKSQMEQQYNSLLNHDQDTTQLEEDIKKQKEYIGKMCTELSMKRVAVAKTIEKNIVKNLAELNMPETTFKVQFTQTKDSQNGVPIFSDLFKLYPTGIDVVEFVFSANPGEPPKPLAQIASGGEVSRIMLAIKSVLADADPIPTMVFDEIDTGIGGRTAKDVAAKLKDLSTKRQIICVTHLPQIASQATHHIAIEKIFDQGTTSVQAQELKNEDERAQEISRMLSGTQSEVTWKHAVEILQEN